MNAVPKIWFTAGNYPTTSMERLIIIIIKRISRAPIYRTRWDTGIYTYRLIMHRQTYRHMCASSYTIGNAVTTDTWQQLFLLVIWTHVPSLCADCIIPCMQFGTPWLGRSTAATSAATPSPAHVFDVSLFKTVFSFSLFFFLLWCATENIWNIFCQGVRQHCYTSISGCPCSFPVFIQWESFSMAQRGRLQAWQLTSY